MSTFTTSAFVAQGEFTPETRKNEAMAFGEEGLKVFDSRDHSTMQEWITEDFTFLGSDGTVSKGKGLDAIDDAKSVHDKLLTKYRHIPSSSTVVDVQDGYKIYSHGHMYANLLAVSALNPAKVSDPDGTKWDIMVSIFSEWDLVKDPKAKHHGLLIKHLTFVIDKSEILKAAQAKGMDVTHWITG